MFLSNDPAVTIAVGVIYFVRYGKTQTNAFCSMNIHGHTIYILLMYIVSVSAAPKYSLANNYNLRTYYDMPQSRTDPEYLNADSRYHQPYYHLEYPVNYWDNVNNYDRPARSIWEKQLDLRRSARQSRFGGKFKRTPLNSAAKNSFKLIDENGGIVGYLQPFSDPFNYPAEKSNVHPSKRESHVQDSFYPIKKMATNLDLSSGSEMDKSIKKLTADDQQQDTSNIEGHFNNELLEDKGVENSNDGDHVAINAQNENQSIGLHEEERDNEEASINSQKDPNEKLTQKGANSSDRVLRYDKITSVKEETAGVPHDTLEFDAKRNNGNLPFNQDAVNNQEHVQSRSIVPKKDKILKVEKVPVSNLQALDKLQEIEENIGNVIEELGLHDQLKAENSKREVEERDLEDSGTDEEDEDMEEGANKMKLIKSSSLQIGRNEDEQLTNVAQKQARSNMKQDTNKRMSFGKRQETAKARAKRYPDKESVIMEDVKNSDESVGSNNNKSPVHEEEKTNERLSENMEDDRSVEEKIRDKIEAIKREIKYEIDELKKTEAQRKKRDVNNYDTLIDKETKEVAPDSNVEEALSPKLEALKRVKRHQQAKRENGKTSKVITPQDKDYLDITREIERLGQDDRDQYHVDPSILLDSIAKSEKLSKSFAFQNELRNGADLKTVPVKSNSPVASDSAANADTKLNSLSSNIVAADVVSKVNEAINSKVDKALYKMEDPMWLVKADTQSAIKRDSNIKNNQKENAEENVQFGDRQLNYKRRRREGAALPEANIAYLPYRPEEGEVDEESDEFDDDGFDDREVRWVKRDSPFNSYAYNYPRSSYNSKYASFGDSEMQNSNNYYRKKRDLNSPQPYRWNTQLGNKQNLNTYRGINKELLHPQNLKGLTEYDIFGALPQSYDSELYRYKRVKRN